MSLQVEFHRYLLQLRLARCPKGKGWLGRKLWRTKTFVAFCLGKDMLMDSAACQAFGRWGNRRLYVSPCHRASLHRP